MATHDYVIANGTGAAVRSDLNNALAAIVSNNSGSSEPGTTYAYQWWADTNANVLKIRNSANNAWITLRELDGTMLIEDGSAGSPGLAFADDTDTGIYSGAADQIDFATGGTERFEIGTTEAVFNEPSNDFDFRVESNNRTHMLFVDGGTDCVGIGVSNPGDFNAKAETLVLANGGDDVGITLDCDTDKEGSIYFADGSSGDNLGRGQIVYNHDGDSLRFVTNASEAVRIGSDNNCSIGTTTNTNKLRVHNGSDNANIILATGADESSEFISLGIDSGVPTLTAGGVSSTSASLAFRTANSGTESEQMRIDSDGRLLVGTTSGDAKLEVRQAQNTTTTGTFTSPHVKLECLTTTNTNGFTGIAYAVSTANNFGWTVGARRVSSSGTDSAFCFRHHSDSVSGTERARLDSAGNWMVGKGASPTTSISTAGAMMMENGRFNAATDGGSVLNINRLTNDGNIAQFYQDTNIEGSISISGSTVSYNGAHLARWSQLASGAARIEILRGSVLSNLDEMCEWGEEDNEQLNRMKVSDVEGDVNVSGVFQAWDDDDDTYTNDFYCAMTGDFVIRIAQGTTVARGDLLMSAGDGTAKPQDDDIVRSKTIAKVTSTTVSTTYSDGSYCVPCVLMAC